MNISKCKIERLIKTSEFKKISNGKFVMKAGVIVKAKKRDMTLIKKNDIVRVGLTCSKKIGNAVKRNRAKRRLNALSKLVFPYYSKAGWDYVLIGKKDETIDISFEEIKKNMIDAMKIIHKGNVNIGS